MGIGTVLLIIVGLFVLFVVIDEVRDEAKKKKAVESKLKSLPHFEATQQVIGCDWSSGIAVDEVRKKLCLLTLDGQSPSARVLSYKDVLSVELFEDGVSLTKTVRASQVGGAIVGGLLLGGVGALVGGLTGKTKTTGKISRVDLRLIVNDTNAPLHDVAFMVVEAKKDGITYPPAIKLARHWHGVVEVIIKRADAEEKNLQDNDRQIPSALPAPSIADEIKKLADLHKSGALTSEEFQQQKLRLLGNNQAIA